MVHGRLDDYRDHPPKAADVLCVIEVADSSLAVDMGPKLRAYAKAGIPQYIVADLVNDRVLVHERPAGESYARVTTMARGEVAPIQAGRGHVRMPADHLLP